MKRLLLAVPVLVACSGSSPKDEWTAEELTRDQLEGLQAHAEDFDRVFGSAAQGPTPPATPHSAYEAPAELVPEFALPAEPVRRRSPLAPHSSKLQVGDEKELPLEATHVAVEVDGFRARVALELYFRNDTDKRLQGMLKLRLPDGASPDYTAFGVAAKVEFQKAPKTSIPDLEQRHASLKQARMVPRARAARAYTDTVRRDIDPALVEWSGAGVYTVRVFPLEPGKLHQIALAYDVDLRPDGDDLVYVLELPEEAGRLEVSIDAEGEKGRFREPEERRFEVRVQNAGDLVLTGDDPATGPLYAARVVPAIPDGPGDPASEAIFLVDTSLSGGTLDERLDLMTSILEANRGALKRFRVGFFDVAFHWWRNEPVANAAALRAYAESLLVEGATDLNIALAAAAKIEGRHDVFLLSDGGATWGSADEPPLRDEHTLFAYAPALDGLARKTGGAAFAPTGDVATAHTKRPWRIESVDAPGTDVLVRGDPAAVYPGQTLVVCGRGAFDGPVALTLSQGGRTITVASKSAQKTPSELTASVYGQAAVARLETLGARDAARAYAQHFRVVGRTCSLVMLESEEDYERYGIRPADDAGFVREHPAAAAAGESGDRLRAWLSTFVEVEGTLAKALEAADRSVPSLPLAARTRLRMEVPGAFVEELAAGPSWRAIEREAERRRELHGAADALKALSTRIEASPGDWDVVRDVAYTALEWGEARSAYHLFRRVAEARPFEPQNFLGMARALEAMGRADLANVWYEVALAGEWDERFGAFRRIASVHYLSFLRKHKDARLETLVPAVEPKAADLVVTIFWNTDNSDVDLHVRDPEGEHCYYSDPETAMGGRLTSDVTQGYGPDMFVLPDAGPGAYAIWAHYYSEDRTRQGSRTRCFATIFENWGRETEQSRTITLVLEDGKQNHPIARMVKAGR